jgi:hypothetical protein
MMRAIHMSAIGSLGHRESLGIAGSIAQFRTVNDMSTEASGIYVPRLDP